MQLVELFLLVLFIFSLLCLSSCYARFLPLRMSGTFQRTVGDCQVLYEKYRYRIG